MEFSVNVLI
uniref:Uncharacterized protein n=1 Tax=Anguilla anguilla TaxID=7936 RepID=A0A0E9VFX4_ANGAN